MANKTAIKFYKNKTWAQAAASTDNSVCFTGGDTAVQAVVVNGKAYGYGNIMSSSSLGVGKLGWTDADDATNGRNYAVKADTAGVLYTNVTTATTDTLGVVKLGSVASGVAGVPTGGDVYNYVNNAYKDVTIAIKDANPASANAKFVDFQFTTLGGSATTSELKHFSVVGAGITVGGQNNQLTLTADVQGVDTTDGISYLKLASNKISIDSTQLQHASSTTSYANDKIALACYVDEKVAGIAGGVYWRGGTTTLPADDDVENGYMYKSTGTFTISEAASQDGAAHTVKEGDTIIAVVTTSGKTKTVKWAYIPSADDVEYTGVKVGNTTVITETKGGTVEFKASGDLSVTGDATGKTVTYSYSHPQYSDAEAAAVKIGRDSLGHVVIGDDLAAKDIKATAIGGVTTSDTDVQTTLEKLKSYTDNTLLDAIDTLDAPTFNLASVSGNTLTMYDIQEYNGIISKNANKSITFTEHNQTIGGNDGTTDIEFDADAIVKFAGSAGINVTAYEDDTESKITIGHSNTAIAGGTVGSSTEIPQITYDSYGHITKVDKKPVVSANDGKLQVKPADATAATTIFSANTSNDTTITAVDSAFKVASISATAMTIGCYWED